MSNDKNMNEEEYLKKHLGDLDNKNKQENNYIPTDIPFMTQQTKDTRATDLQYFNFDIRELPCGRFYPTGTLFMVRPAQVREIQSYSMVDDNNFYDVVEKMNDMLQACVRIKYPDGRMASYLDIKDPDRLYLIFLIRELTFQQGNSLAVTVKCDHCSEENQIELKRTNFVFHDFDSKLDKYFNQSSKQFEFETTNGKSFEIIPPNIGLQKAFTDYIIKENNEKRVPNLAFLKIIPFMLGGRTAITYEGIKAKLKEFEELDDISFQFLNGAISKMTFGIKELKKICTGCGEEVRTKMEFPNGASGIFVIHDAFETFIKE
jgi:hypothetical protein